jgi:multidrug resistance efflux pump
MPLPSRERIEKARLQAEQAKARLQALEARVGEAERKLDTRRKIILGGLLLDAASKDERYAKVISALMQRIERDNDRKAFEEWEPPVHAAPSSAPSPTPNGSTGQP